MELNSTLLLLFSILLEMLVGTTALMGAQVIGAIIGSYQLMVSVIFVYNIEAYVSIKCLDACCFNEEGT